MKIKCWHNQHKHRTGRNFTPKAKASSPKEPRTKRWIRTGMVMDVFGVFSWIGFMSIRRTPLSSLDWGRWFQLYLLFLVSMCLTHLISIIDYQYQLYNMIYINSNASNHHHPRVVRLRNCLRSWLSFCRRMPVWVLLWSGSLLGVPVHMSLLHPHWILRWNLC